MHVVLQQWFHEVLSIFATTETKLKSKNTK